MVLYHFFPDWIPSGLLGVDVFFVLSGYLITGILWRDLEHAKGIKELGAALTRFWARRARRLIPAALVVLAVTAALAYAFGPRSWWLDINAGWIWAVAYVANWFLANEAADYLRADAPVSPYQHYWSLSVEEQFYIVLPILLALILLLVLVKRFRAIVFVLSLVSVLSLGYAFYMQVTDPAYGFYSSLTRLWEFGAGGLLALAQTKGKLNHVPKKLLSVIWLGLIVVMVIPHDPHLLVYHNVIAILLTLLAIVVSKNSFEQKYFAPVVFLGDYSYSIYLWHWPILVLSPWILGHSLLSGRIREQAAAMLLILLIAVLSKKLIEDPIRFGGFSRLRSSFQILATLLVSAALIASNLAFGSWVTQEAKANQVTYNFTPSLLELGDDKSIAEDGEWIIRRDQEGFKVSEFGNREGTMHIALVGDSHARQYFAPLNELSEKYGFALDMISKSACSVQDPSDYQLAPYGGGLHCKEWNLELQNYLAEHRYDLVINSNSTLVHDGAQAPAKSFAKAVQGWVDAGQKVLLIRDNPKPNVADAISDFRFCIELYGDLASEKCSTPIEAALTPNDTMFDLGSGIARVETLDITSILCPDGVSCPVIMDNTIVYRDGSHMSLSFTKKLVAPIEEKLRTIGVLSN